MGQLTAAGKSTRYSIYEVAVFGAVRLEAEIEAGCDREALKQARQLLPNGPAELRQDNRVICRFGRSKDFPLRS